MGAMSAARLDTRTEAQRHRPYDPAVMRVIRERIADGPSLRAVVKELGVSRSAVNAWILDSADAADQYARARELQADARFDRITDLADWAIERALTGDVTQEQIAMLRVAIDAEKWATSKLRPKVYGDKLDIALETRTELLVLDYGRSASVSRKQEPVIDVPVIAEHASSDAAPIPKKRKRSKASEAKRKANRAKLDALRAKLKRASARRRGGRG
jgi:DNA-binding transcriptional regulator YdaS (Cro superfamily)